ncbi:hypothetical protein MauCBS54593_006294 [Microsporum audouinii]
MSKFVPKDPSAVSRGKRSAEVRREKRGENSIDIEDIPSVKGGKVVLINNTTGENITLQNVDPSEVESQSNLITLDDFMSKNIMSRLKLDTRVFNSELDSAELAALDLKANSIFFPELVNRNADLRQRPITSRERDHEDGKFTKRKINLQEDINDAKRLKLGSIEGKTVKPISEESRTDALERLRSKARWFRDFEIAAKQQACKYEEAAMEIENNSSPRILEEVNLLSTYIPMGIEGFLVAGFPKSGNKLSKEEWKNREVALISHVHAIAERYRQELSFLAINANKAITLLKECNTITATLLSASKGHYLPNIDIASWVYQKTNNCHYCKCDICKSGSKSQDLKAPEQILHDLIKENEGITAAITTAKGALDTLTLRESVKNPKLKEPRNAQWQTEQIMVKPIDTKATEATAKAMEAMVNQFLREREAHSIKLETEWDTEQARIHNEVIREEWSMKERKENHNNQVNELRRLQNYWDIWEEKKKNNTEKYWQVYSVETFPEVVSLTTEEIGILYGRNAVGKIQFWKNKQKEYDSLSESMKRAYIQAIEQKFEALLLELKDSEQKVREEVYADEIARKLPLGDEELLQLLKTPLLERQEWLNSREGRLQLLSPVERLFYQLQSEFRQFSVSTSTWPDDKEYTILSREISYGSRQLLYGKGPGGPSLFDFNSNEAWEAFAEEREDVTPRF